MLQKGTLYSPANNENAVEVNKPIPNIFLYFSRNGDRVVTTKTDGQGKFSFDLPIGSYQVTMSRGAGSQIHPLCAGALFELKSNSAQNAFEKWVLSSIYIKPEENPFVIMLQEIAQEAKNSAVSAKTSAELAEKTAREFNENTIGSGKVMREGAYGLGGVNYAVPEKQDEYNEESFTGVYATVFPPAGMSQFSTVLRLTRVPKVVMYEMLFNLTSNIVKYRRYRSAEGGWQEYIEFLTDSNTTVDSNGFIKAASPIIKLFDDRIETNGQFKEEPVFEKIGVGTYKISNTLGLAKNGWTYEKPRGKDGNPYFRIIVKKTDDGCIISVHDEFEALEEATITDIDGNERKINKVVKILGEARDIKPHERWIDLRFHEEPEEIEEEQSDLDKFLEDNDAVLL